MGDTSSGASATGGALARQVGGSEFQRYMQAMYPAARLEQMSRAAFERELERFRRGIQSGYGY